MSNHTDRLGEQSKLWLGSIASDLRQAVQREVEGLRASIDERIAALEAAVSRNDELYEQAVLKVRDLATEEVETAGREARQRAEATAQSEMAALQTRLHAELESERAEFELVRTTLETQLSETERDITAIRRNRDDHAVSLDEARQRTEALEEANAQMARLRQVADARLDEEVQRRTAVAMQLDAARQEIVLARAEADSCRLEAHVAGERVHALETRLYELERAAELRTTAALDGDRPGVLSRLKQGLSDIGSAKGEEVLSRLVEHLSEHFAATAVFTVDAQSLRLWKGRVGHAAAAVPAADALSLEGESTLARAFRHRTTVTVDAPADGAPGLWETSLGHAMAFPIVAYGRVVALAYAENPPGDSDDRVQMLETVAEILVGCVSQRLNRNQPAADLQTLAPQANTPSLPADADHDGISRRARRVKLEPPVEIIVDGVASTLVNLSALGAQIVAPLHLRLNRCVRIVLPDGSSPLTCEGRIVWARLESAQPSSPAAYRAGVRFAGVDPRAVLTYIAQHSAAAELIG